METGALTAAGVTVHHPLYRYQHMSDEWEVVSHTLASPLPNGTVAYYQDSLSPAFTFSGPVPFAEGIGKALCEYLCSRVLAQRLEVTDGPYIQRLEEDGSVPTGWVMLRAIVWTEEFDLLVPMDGGASVGELAVSL